MDSKLFDLLEEKINKTLGRIQELTRENEELRHKLQEQEELVQEARNQMDGIEEERVVIRNKIDGLLDKINRIIEKT